MALSSPPTSVAPFDKGRLNAGITASDTTLYVAPIFKTVNGVRVKQGINTTSGCAIISAGDFTELVTYTGASVDSTTKITTITGLTRGRDPTQTTASASFASGTGRIWAKGAKFTVVADATYFQSGVFTNVANTFTDHQTIATTKELRFKDSDQAIYETGDELYFKSSTTSAKSLAQLSAAGGSDEKVGVSINDTTPDYLFNKLAEGAGITLTETNNGGDEDVTIAAVNTVATGHTGLSTVTTGGLLVGAGTDAMTIIGPGTSGQVPVSNGTTIAMGNAIPTGTILPSALRTASTGWLICNGSAVSRSTYADLFSALTPTVGTFTVTIASPAVFSLAAHGLIAGDQIYFTTTGALPTGLTANTVYYVLSTSLTADEFTISTTLGGSQVNTSGTQSGTHTAKLCPFGVGDGSTTFNVPDLRGRFPAGSDTMGTSAASRMTISNTALGDVGGTANGAHTHTLSTTAVSSGGGATGVSSSTSGSTNVLPPYISLFYIIKT